MADSPTERKGKKNRYSSVMYSEDSSGDDLDLTLSMVAEDGSAYDSESASVVSESGTTESSSGDDDESESYTSSGSGTSTSSSGSFESESSEVKPEDVVPDIEEIVVVEDVVVTKKKVVVSDIVINVEKTGERPEFRKSLEVKPGLLNRGLSPRRLTSRGKSTRTISPAHVSILTDNDPNLFTTGDTDSGFDSMRTQKISWINYEFLKHIILGLPEPKFKADRGSEGSPLVGSNFTRRSLDQKADDIIIPGSLYDVMHTDVGKNNVMHWFLDHSVDSSMDENYFVVFMRKLTKFEDYHILDIFDVFDYECKGSITWKAFFLIVALITSYICRESTRFLYLHRDALFPYILQGTADINLHTYGFVNYSHLIRITLLLRVKENHFLHLLKEEFGKTKDDLLTNKISIEEMEIYYYKLFSNFDKYGTINRMGVSTLSQGPVQMCSIL